MPSDVRDSEDEQVRATSLTPVQRRLAAAVGTAATLAGAVAVFVSANGAGTVALLVLGALFSAIGLLGLVPTRVRMGEAEVDFQPALDALREAPVPTSERDPDQALHDLAVRYEAIRGVMSGGDARTLALEGVLLQVRTLASGLPSEQVSERVRNFVRAGEGDRVVTLALLEARPQGDGTAAVALQTSLNAPKSAFEQYHAFRAALACFYLLENADRQRVKAAARAYLAAPGNDPLGDRGTLADRLLALS